MTADSFDPDVLALAGMPAVQPIGWPRFRKEIEAIYSTMARSTFLAMRWTLDLMERLGVETTHQLDVQFVARFLSALDPALSPWTVKARLLQLQALCSIAEQHRYLAISPFRLRKIRKWVRTGPPRSKPHLSRVEIRLLLDTMKADIEAKRGWPQWRARRLYALTCTVAYCGLRAGEAQRLHVADLDLAGRVIDLVPHGKRLKTEASAQPVPMPEALIPILSDWLVHRLDRPPGWKLPDDVPHLFPTACGLAPWTSGAYGGRPIDRIRAVGKGIGLRVNFQTLRRSYATHAESWGLGGAAIQRVLRHTDSRTTEVFYRRPDVANLTAAVKDADF